MAPGAASDDKSKEEEKKVKLYISAGLINNIYCRARNREQAAQTVAGMKRRGGGGTRQERRCPQNFYFWYTVF